MTAIIHLDRRRLEELVLEAEESRLIEDLRSATAFIRESIESAASWISGAAGGETVMFRREIILSELDQVLESRTIERARYYLRRLRKGISEVRANPVNEINLARWKEYEHIWTDSLWNLPRRDTSGAHLGWYWGNFVPQIPRQMMLRYTRRGDWVLDPFAGSGTTLIECRRLGRNGLGIELNEEVAGRARLLLEAEANAHSVSTAIISGDASVLNAGEEIRSHAARNFQLIVMHPPYHDIISFSEDERDLSRSGTTESFLEMFGRVLDNCSPHLERGRFLALVIGDKYSRGEWVPLGFRCMEEVLRRDYSLKSTIVKNFDETRAKREQKQLWRYRALAGGFYVFKHEYIFVFKKR